MNPVAISASTLVRVVALASQALEMNEAADIVNLDDITAVNIALTILENALAGRATSKV